MPVKKSKQKASKKSSIRARKKRPAILRDRNRESDGREVDNTTSDDKPLRLIRINQ